MLYSVNSIYYRQFFGGKRGYGASSGPVPVQPKTEKEIKAQPLTPTSA